MSISSHLSLYNVGNWVKNMRRLKKIDKLEPEKVMRLTQIGFEFVPVARETAKFTAQWHASFMQLKGQSYSL